MNTIDREMLESIDKEVQRLIEKRKGTKLEREMEEEIGEEMFRKISERMEEMKLADEMKEAEAMKEAQTRKDVQAQAMKEAEAAEAGELGEVEAEELGELGELCSTPTILAECNICFDDEHKYIVLEVPGFEKGNISAYIEDNQLTIKGERVMPSAEYEEQEFMEPAEFENAFQLSDNIKVDDIKVANGILTITLTQIQPVRNTVEIN